MAGLDLLCATRLKVACSLLAGERITVILVEWGTERAELLVADESSEAGSAAIQLAIKQKTPLVRIVAAARPSSQTCELSRLPSVRELVEALKSAICREATSTADTDAGWSAPLPHPFLEHLRLDRRREKRTLLELGLFRAVSNSRSGTLHMLRRMPLEELLKRALDPGWWATDVPDSEWESVYLPDVTSTHAIETIWWSSLPRLSEVGFPRVAGTSRLRAWPVLDAGTAPGSWPMILAKLSIRPWCAEALASRTSVSVHEVQKVMALARLSGLEAPMAEAGRNARATTMTHVDTVLRLAKRFGLRLMGNANG